MVYGVPRPWRFIVYMNEILAWESNVTMPQAYPNYAHTVNTIYKPIGPDVERDPSRLATACVSRF
jgi:hypothetical protein